MIDNNDIVIFDSLIDYDLLLSTYKKNKNLSKNYNDDRKNSHFKNWKIIRFNFDYAKNIVKKFKLQEYDVRPRFYELDANTTLKEHVDFNTQCSLNFVLNDNTSPVIVNNNIYYYKNCLLNTTQKHSVVNNDKERIIFKLSIMDCSFKSVKRKLKNVL